jgi:hypothetical protein
LASPTTRSCGPEQLHILTNDFDFVSLLSRGLVFPSIHLKSSLNKNGLSLMQPLTSDFRLPSPQGNVKVSDLFLPFSRSLIDKSAIHSQADVTNGRAFGSKTDLWIAREVADEHDFIQTGHRFLP